MTKMTKFCMNMNYRRYQDETSNWIVNKKSRFKK